MKFLLITILLISSLLTGCKRELSYEKPSLLPQQVTKGVNLVGWFSDGASPAAYKTRFPNEILQAIKAAGFNHIRIPIGRSILFQENNPGDLNVANAAYLDSAIQMAVNAGLAVVLDGLHADNLFELRIVTEAGFEDKFINYWKAIVNRYKKYAPSDLFFELYNEPYVRNNNTIWVPDNWWSKTQKKLVSAIRIITENHYLVLTGNRSFITGLKAAPPTKGKNLIYNFHFYDPYMFTHQGSPSAGWDAIVIAKDVPYPSSPEALAPLINSASDIVLKGFLTTYGNDRYSKDSLEKWIFEAYEWGRENDVMLTCNEFGTYRGATPIESRMRYFSDVRSILQKYKIGWAVWEFDLQFGIKNSGVGGGIISEDYKGVLGLQ